MLLVPRPPSTTDRTAELSAELIRHARMLHAIRSRMTTWSSEGLEWGALKLLAHLVKDGPQRQGELAECAMLDPSTVSRHVAQLVKGGWVERRPDPSDGRAVRLAPTEAGHRTFAEVGRRRDAMLREVLAGWADEDVAVLVASLRRLNDDFDRYRPVMDQPSAQENR